MQEAALYRIPSLDMRGSPFGIDCREVVDQRLAPVINTGIAHRQAGVGQIGAGIVNAPLACFAVALREVRRRWRAQME